MRTHLRTAWAAVIVASVCVVSVWAADWPMPGGNPQRNGWAGSEQQLGKANIQGLKLLYKYQSDNVASGSRSLTPPIISGNLITYRGFKEMLMFAGSSNKVFSVDADLNQPIWETDLKPPAQTSASQQTGTCPGALTSPLIMAGSSSSSLHFAARASQAPAASGQTPPRRSPYWPPLSETISPLLPTTLTQLNALYTVSSDGYLHVINSSTGEDLIPAVSFVPANTSVTSLNIRDNVVYATTVPRCAGGQSALLALDLLSRDRTVASFVAPQGGFSGSAGTTIGNDGTVYVQVAYPAPDQPKHLYDAIVALTPKDIKVKDYVLLSRKPLKKGTQPTGVTPTVFSFPGHDVLIAAGKDDRLHLLDSRSLGGTDHRTPLYSSDVLVKKGKGCDSAGFRGSFSTWLDVDTGKRRFYVPVSGELRNALSSEAPASKAGGSSILALELGGTTEQPVLNPIWNSSTIESPDAPVIANGMVFVLSTGQPTCATGKRQRVTAESGMGLYVLDAATGKQLHTVTDIGSAASGSTGMALANGRLYVAGQDSAVYCFGVPSQQRQLVEQ